MALTRPKIKDIDTSVVGFMDPITVLNQGATSANVDVGFLFNRANGLVSNVSVYWSETNQSFITAFTSNTGATNANITPSSYANLTIGSLLTVNGAAIVLSTGTGLKLNNSMGNYGDVITSTGTGVQWAAPGGFTGGIVVNQIIANATAATTSISTGALIVPYGGIGVNGNIYLSGNVVSSATGADTIPVGTTAQRPGAASQGMIRYNTTISSFEGYGAGNAWSSLGGVKSVDGKAYISAEASAGAGDDVLRFYSGSTGTSTQVMWASGGNISILPTTAATSTTTGALQVAGGVGISGATYFGANINVQHIIPTANVTYDLGSPTNRFRTLYISGNTIDIGGATMRSDSTGITFTHGSGSAFTVAAAGTTPTTSNASGAFGNVVVSSGVASSSTTTGALIVTGGAGISGDLNVGGTLYVSNLQARGSTTLQVQDPLLYLTANVVYPWNYDTGIFSHSIGGPANTYVHHGMVRSSTNGYWGFFSNVKSEPGATINWADTGIIWDAAKVGSLIVANTTASSSTTSGALQVAGGAGIAGAMNIGGQITSTVATGTAPFVVSSTTKVTNLNVDLLDGAHLDSAYNSFGSGTIPLRHSSGYLFSNYYNMTADQTTGTATRIAVETSSDNYLRWQTPAQFITNHKIVNYTVSATAPSSPGDGAYWYNSSTDTLYQYIFDGTNRQWVDVSSGLQNSATSATANTLALRDSNADLYATVFRGKATSAQYADLAENYLSDSNYEPGTVVVFGGAQEITTTDKSHDSRVAGVISTKPAYLMNSECTGLPVAFTGRVPCKVVGRVQKGDVLVTSNIAGAAEAIDVNKYVPGCVIGKALENKNNIEIEIIEVVVGRF